MNLAKLLWNIARFLLRRYPQLGCYLGGLRSSPLSACSVPGGDVCAVRGVLMCVCGSCAGALATAAPPLNAAVARFRNQGLWLGPLRLPHGATQIGPGEQICERAIYQRPASRDSTVSFGSDLQVESWFAEFAWIDMEWVRNTAGPFGS